MAMATREAYGRALAALGEKYDFMVLDADLAKATQTVHFQKAFPNRFFNMGIAECDMMGTAAGMATTGLKVFATTFAMFATGRAYEQVRNSICYPNLPVVVSGTHAGVMIGEDGASHQAIEDISLMRTLPNMTVVVPCDSYSTTRLTELLIGLDSPAYIRTGRNPAVDVYQGNESFALGKGNVLKDGKDVAIFAIGDMVHEALVAAEQLATQGVQAAVIDMFSIKPIDRELVEQYIKKAGKIVTVEDHSIMGGLGSAVSEIVAEVGGATMRRVGVQDTFGRSGKGEDLQKYYGLTAAEIISAVKSLG